MIKTIEKTVTMSVPEGKDFTIKAFLVKTKKSEDGKNIELRMICELEMDDEIIEEEPEENLEEEPEENLEEEPEENLEEEPEEDLEEEPEEDLEEESEEDFEEESNDELTEKSKMKKYTFEDYKKSSIVLDELLEKVWSELQEIKQRTGRDEVRWAEAPSYKEYEKAASENYIIGQQVRYSGKLAGDWRTEWNFRFIKRVWKIHESWYHYETSKEPAIERTIEWDGTMEEYVEKYGISGAFRDNFNGKYYNFGGKIIRNFPPDFEYGTYIEVFVEWT